MKLKLLSSLSPPLALPGSPSGSGFPAYLQLSRVRKRNYSEACVVTMLLECNVTYTDLSLFPFFFVCCLAVCVNRWLISSVSIITSQRYLFEIIFSL